jgi:pimeloyl-ACP methyl ester carboxylesterase
LIGFAQSCDNSAAMPFFEHDGIRFHYRDQGAGVPFVFQHGLGADADQTFELVRPPEGFRLLTFDCRGHGETRPVGPDEGISVVQFTEDLRAFLDFLQIDRAVVGGISMGAEIALNFALHFPQRVLGLVLSRPAWLDESRQDNMQVFATIASYIRKYGAWEGAQRFQQTATYQEVLRLSPDNASSLLAQFTHPRAEETVAKLERIPVHAPRFTRRDWNRICVPTLVLVNRLDAIHPFEFGEVYVNAVPGASLVEVAAKSVNKEQHAADVQRALDDFLKKAFGHEPRP